MDILIRSAVVAELPSLKSFEQGIITAERPYDETLRPDPISYYDIGELLNSPDSEVVVAEVDGELIASGYVRKKRSLHYVVSEYHAFIGFLYVAPEYRGQGVNKLILDRLFAWAKENDLPDVHLTVYPDNAPAIRAYEKSGFKGHILEMNLNLNDKGG